MLDEQNGGAQLLDFLAKCLEFSQYLVPRLICANVCHIRCDKLCHRNQGTVSAHQFRGLKLATSGRVKSI